MYYQAVANSCLSFIQIPSDTLLILVPIRMEVGKQHSAQCPIGFKWIAYSVAFPSPMRSLPNLSRCWARQPTRVRVCERRKQKRIPTLCKDLHPCLPNWCHQSESKRTWMYSQIVIWWSGVLLCNGSNKSIDYTIIRVHSDEHSIYSQSLFVIASILN